MDPLYNTIGAVYGATRRADPAITQSLAHFLGLHAGARYLDLACGTGNYTYALAALGGRWTGIDISDTMLAQASAKTREIDWQLGSADALPYDDRHFDGAMCTLAIHHFPELHGPFKEVFRVLGEGKFVLFTSFPEQMRNYWLYHYFPEMIERGMLQMPARERLVSALSDAGFEIDAIVPFDATNELQDLFLYAGKERPELYFDPLFRSNTSAFAALCPAGELERGLAALRADIDSGAFHAVTRAYSDPVGDYAYVVARKHTS